MTAGTLTEFGIGRVSAFADTVLFIVSELVANAQRHAAGTSSTVDVGVTVGAGHLVLGVADGDSAAPDLAGTGLRSVAELAARYEGTLSVQPAPAGSGKTVLVRVPLPDSDAGGVR